LGIEIGDVTSGVALGERIHEGECKLAFPPLS